MKIINIGILAHVDAGKTTLTESLLYASGAISEPGSVEKGTTRTDTMFLERQRGITIQAAVTSFQWHRCKVNIVDTPGHMDFLAEVYRSLAVLDGAILVISAKDGVQAQTRILFHALRKMNIPTVIFINKIDQAGVDLQSVVQSVRDKLSADIIIKQTVSLSPEIVLEENTDIEAWDAVIENNDKLLEKYIAGEPISREKLVREEQRRVQDASLFPVYYGSAKKGLGIQPLMDAVTGLFQPIGEQGSAALCGSVFKVEYTDCGQRRVYLRLYSGTLRLRDTVALAGREKLKITEMRIPSKGEIVRTDTAYPGEIVILPSDSVRLNDVLGDPTRLPRKRWREDPLPMLRTTIAPKTAAQRERLLDALTQLADTDPLLRCEVDSITHEIILSFLGRVQLEVVSALLSEKYKLETVVKEPSVIYMERPLKAASHTIHIEVPPNPFWASIGLSVTPLSLGSGVQYESRVSLGYLNQSFQNAVRDGIRYGLEQGLFGWNVTDCKICFEYGLYYSPVSDNINGLSTLQGLQQIFSGLLIFCKQFFKPPCVAVVALSFTEVNNFSGNRTDIVWGQEIPQSVDHQIFYVLFSNRLFVTGFVPAVGHTLIIVIFPLCLTRPTDTSHGGLTASTEQFCGKEIIYFSLRSCGGFFVFLHNALCLPKQIFINDAGESIRNFLTPCYVAFF